MSSYNIYMYIISDRQFVPKKIYNEV